MAATVQLENATTYRGRAIVSYPSVVVTHDAVIAELAKYGITPAKVWFKASDLPSDWPASARADVSPSFTTQIFLEGTWTKPSGQYATSGPKWGIYDYWVFKTAPKQAPPPVPTCTDVGGSCSINAQCCSYNCEKGICAAVKGDSPPPPNAECGSEGMECQNLSCCEGLTCQEYDGGMLCLKSEAQDIVVPEPVKLDLDAKINDWWYAAGAAAVVGIGWLLWPKLMPKPVMANPEDSRRTRRPTTRTP